MKILFYRYGSICEPDIINAFEELGHTVTQLTDEITNKGLTPQECIKTVSDSLLNQPQDFVFSINFFPFISEVCNIFKIRYLAWTVDSPVMELYAKSITNEWNRVFLFDYAQYEEFHPLNPDCIFHLPLAANVKNKDFVIQTASDAQRKKFAADVSFVGSLYTEKCPYDKLTNPSPYLNGFLNGIIQAQMKVYGYYFIDDVLTDEIVSEFKEHLPFFYTYPAESYLTNKITMSQLYIGNKITALERLETMKHLSENFTTTIYTGSDTSAFPKLINRGFAKSLTEMPIIFHESKINLSTTSKPIRTGLPQRIWDIMSCGGFVLSNYQAEIPELLQPDSDLVLYGSIDELVEKCHYYLEHEKERQEIARNGYETLCQHHTYPIRLTQMLSLAFSR